MLIVVTIAACQDEPTGPDNRGTLRVLVLTVGASLDTNGYSYQVGSSNITLAVQDSQEIQELPAGQVPVGLGGLATNCRAFSPGPDSVLIASGQITKVSLVVSCDSALRNLILFDHWTAAGTPEVWMARPDGSGKQRFFAGASDATATPTGTEVIYRDWTTSRLWKMRADTTKRQPVVPGLPGGQYRPDVSPDGRAVVFEVTTGGPTDIYRANLDGSEIRQLTQGGRDFEPRWSPDGHFITFTRLSTDVQLYRIPAEGGDTVPLTALGHGSLARWSPQGDRLLFFNPAANQLWAMAADGSNPGPLQGAAQYGAYAEWSPDGTEILVELIRDGLTRIQRIPLDGAPIVTVTDPGQYELGRWLR